MTAACLSALTSGCATVSSGSYCDVAEPHYFGGPETVAWLLEHDRALLADTVTHNETWARLCQ